MAVSVCQICSPTVNVTGMHLAQLADMQQQHSPEEQQGDSSISSALCRHRRCRSSSINLGSCNSSISPSSFALSYFPLLQSLESFHAVCHPHLLGWFESSILWCTASAVACKACVGVVSSQGPVKHWGCLVCACMCSYCRYS